MFEKNVKKSTYICYSYSDSQLSYTVRRMCCIREKLKEKFLIIRMSYTFQKEIDVYPMCCAGLCCVMCIN